MLGIILLSYSRIVKFISEKGNDPLLISFIVVVASFIYIEFQLSREMARDKLNLLATTKLDVAMQAEKLKIPAMEKSISGECEREIAEIVDKFNNDDGKKCTEKSGSVNDPASIHHLWKLIFDCMQRRHGPMTRRLVYEWYIPNALADKKNSIDFSFVPSSDKYLNWDNYSGGLVMNINPPSSSSTGEPSTAPGPVVNLVSLQAKNRAAMCVYTRLLSEPTKKFKSYCCYADSRRLALVRVSMKSVKPYCEVHDTGAMDLPGFGTASASSSTPNTTLNLLYHLLYSSDEDLEYFMTPPKVSRHPTEFKDSNNVLSTFGR